MFRACVGTLRSAAPVARLPLASRRPAPPLTLPCAPALPSLRLPPQVATIRQVEVDIQEELVQQRGSQKEEASKLKLWGGKATELAAQLAERDGGAGRRGAAAVRPPGHQPCIVMGHAPGG